MKKAIRIILLLAILGGGAYWWWRTHDGSNTNRILVSGNLELEQVDISFKMAGRLIERPVTEGDWVKKGQLLARLDPVQLQRQESRDKAITASAVSNYQQLETSIQFQRATIESDVAARRAEQAEAQAKLDALLNGNRPQDVQQAAAAVTDAKAQLDFAKSDWDRSQTLFKNEDISKQQYDQSRQKVDSATAMLRQADERYSLMKEGARAEDIAAARASVAKSAAAVKTAEANRLELQRKEEELGARKAEIERSRAQAGMSESQLDDTSVYAPMDGVVLVKAAEVGEVLGAGTNVMTLGNLNHPWLRAYINETDLGRVKLGQTVKLTTDSFPNKSYTGHIVFISSEAEFTPKQIQTQEERVKLVYRIKIDVDNAEHELKNNMPVDAEIQLGTS
jgi:HlyD family secretion protein